MNLVGIAGVVAQHVDHQRQIAGAGLGDRLAVVEHFQRGQFFFVLLDQIGQAIQQPAAVAGVHLRPGARLERLAGGGHGPIDVGRVPLGHLGNHFFGRRVNRFERLAAGGRRPLATDETLRLLNLGLGEPGG